MDVNTNIFYFDETTKNISCIEIGKPYPALTAISVGTKFDLTDCGGILACMVNNPTDYMKQQFRAGTPFEMRYIRIKDTIFFIAKIGKCNWCDAPYTPHLSKCLTNISAFADMDELMLTMHLINSAYEPAIVENNRVISLSKWFTAELLKDVKDILSKPFDKQEYVQNVKSVYTKYNSKDLAKMATIYTKL